MKLTEKETKFWNNLKEYYDNIEDMKADYDLVGGRKLAENGCFAISYYDQMQALVEAGYKLHKTTYANYAKYVSTVQKVLPKVFGYYR